MKFSIISAFCLAATAVALPSVGLTQRDTSSGQTAVNGGQTRIATDFQSMTAAVKAFNPNNGVDTIKGYYSIQGNHTKLTQDLQNTVSALQSGGKLGLTDSLAVFLARVSLEPLLLAYFLTMVAWKPKFDDVFGVFSIRKTILDLIQQQDGLVQQMDQALEDILDPFVAYGMKALALAEHAGFEGLEAFYEIPAPAGIIELPDGQLPELPAAASGVL